MATQLSTFVSWLESDKNSCFLAGLNDKQSAMQCACSVGDLVSIPGPEISLVKGMGTHSGILAWRTPWTEEPGRLQSMASQRIGHDRVTNSSLY